MQVEYNTSAWCPRNTHTHVAKAYAGPGIHTYTPNYFFINSIPFICLSLPIPLRSSNMHYITFVLTSLHYHLITITSPYSYLFR